MGSSTLERGRVSPCEGEGTLPGRGRRPHHCVRGGIRAIKGRQMRPVIPDEEVLGGYE